MHRIDMINTIKALIDNYEKLFKEDKIYSGKDIKFMLSKIKEDLEEIL